MVRVLPPAVKIHIKVQTRPTRSTTTIVSTGSIMEHPGIEARVVSSSEKETLEERDDARSPTTPRPNRARCLLRVNLPLHMTRSENVPSKEGGKKRNGRKIILALKNGRRSVGYEGRRQSERAFNRAPMRQRKNENSVNVCRVDARYTEGLGART